MRRPLLEQRRLRADLREHLERSQNLRPVLKQSIPAAIEALEGRRRIKSSAECGRVIGDRKQPSRRKVGVVQAKFLITDLRKRRNAGESHQQGGIGSLVPLVRSKQASVAAQIEAIIKTSPANDIKKRRETGFVRRQDRVGMGRIESKSVGGRAGGGGIDGV